MSEDLPINFDADMAAAMLEDDARSTPVKWEPKFDKSLHHQIIRLAHLRYKNFEIAGMLNICTQTVSNVLTSDRGQKKLTVFTEAADSSTMALADEILRRAPLALDVLDELMLNPDVAAPVRKAIAVDALDRAGHGAIRRSESFNVNANRYITDDDLKGLQERAMEIARENGVVKLK